MLCKEIETCVNTENFKNSKKVNIPKKDIVHKQRINGKVK